jgi:retinol dehydrogenase 12
MQDKIVLITGATNGIGEIAAIELARMGAQVVVVSRNEGKCRRTVETIQRETGNDKAAYLAADLSSLQDIRQLADNFLAQYGKLHVLLNNAGAYFQERRESVDGYEMTFALNHLNYFLLTHLLLDRLKETASEDGEARIVNVSSEAHRFSAPGINFDDLQRTQKFEGFRVYGESKLMNVMFTYELARRLQDSNVTVNALHPGFVRTGFGKNNDGIVGKLLGLAQIFARSPQKGAETSIYLAASPDVKGISGKYFADKSDKKSSSASYDEGAQQRLWQISEDITGIQQRVVV